MEMPASVSRFITPSSHPKSYTPSSGSSRDHEKMPSDTAFTCAFFIMRTSASRMSGLSSH